METSASFEARLAPLSYPTVSHSERARNRRFWITPGKTRLRQLGDKCPSRRRGPSFGDSLPILLDNVEVAA